MRGLTAAGLAALPGTACAHAFGQSYVLPVPFSLYAWGGSAALLLSFLVAALFMRHPSLHPTPAGAVLTVPLRLVQALRGAALAALLLTLATGLTGPRDPYLNPAMTLFWILFVLGLTYLTAVTGDVFTHISPWRTLVLLTRQLSGRRQVVALPVSLGRWPAVLLYAGFIAVELFGDLGPRGLCWLLLAYSVGTVLAGWWLGPQWLCVGEVFAVVLAQIGRCAPLHWTRCERSLVVRLRWPLQGLLTASSRHGSDVVLILLLLAATAFDGLHMTQWWAKLYWESVFGMLQPWLGSNIVTAWPLLKQLHGLWELGALLLSPLLYLAVYLGALILARHVTGSALPVTTLARRFAPSLLPIALAYHASHYHTLVLTQGLQIGWLLSDPFGLGWQLPWSRRLPALGLLPDMGTVWHTQVGLILAGHVASVWLAHHEALRCFGSPRQAWLSQLPLLGLMMAMTVSGLWILAQPITPG